MKYIIDIDGTICHTTDGDYVNSIPIQSRINRVNELYELGHHIVYWTARGGNSKLDWAILTQVQLKTWGCKYHEVRMNKPVYDIWIDDKAENSEDFFK